MESEKTRLYLDTSAFTNLPTKTSREANRAGRADEVNQAVTDTTFTPFDTRLVFTIDHTTAAGRLAAGAHIFTA